MVINAVCPHCKRVYPVDEQYAGQTFSCETCGNPFTVPVPGVVQPVAAVPAMGTARPTIEFAGEISRERRLAALFCFILCGLLYASACCCGLGGVGFLVLPNAVPPGIAPGVLAAFCLGICAFGGVVATVYLVCGIFVRKRGFVSAVIALVVASLHALILLVMLIMAIAQAGMGGFRGGGAGGFVFALSFYGIFLLALCPLIYFLIKVLREPRN